MLGIAASKSLEGTSKSISHKCMRDCMKSRTVLCLASELEGEHLETKKLVYCSLKLVAC